MTVSRSSVMQYYGVVGDTKPTTYAGVAVLTNAAFLETDTRRVYYFDGTNWLAPKSIGQFDLFGTTVATGTNALQYANLNTQMINATETIVDNIWDYTVTVKRFRLVVHSNAKTGNTIVALRDDGADVTGTAITIATTATGEFDSGALSVDIAAGSKINWKIDTSASASGAITLWGWVVWEALLQ